MPPLEVLLPWIVLTNADNVDTDEYEVIYEDFVTLPVFVAFHNDEFHPYK